MTCRPLEPAVLLPQPPGLFSWMETANEEVARKRVSSLMGKLSSMDASDKRIGAR